MAAIDKKTISMFTLALGMAFLVAALIFAPVTPARAELLATPSSSTVVVDKKIVLLDVYNIGGNNYFNLRDLAYVLNGSAKSFEVGFDNNAKTILLTGNRPYTPVGGEMALTGGATAVPLPNEAMVLLNGQQIMLTAYTIGDNTYFKLRDVAQALDFSVEWNSRQGVIIIDTGRGYSIIDIADTTVPLGQTPLPASEVSGQKIGEPLNEADLGEPRRIIEDPGAQLRFYGDYSRFTLACVSGGNVVYAYTNYGNDLVQADKLFADTIGGSKIYAVAAGRVPSLDAGTTEQLLFELTNAFRGYHGLTPLRWNDTLSSVARAHSQDMARRNFFSHLDPNGKGTDSRLTKAGYPWQSYAENIVEGYQNAVIAIDMLIISEPHRKNLLITDCDEIGVGWIKTENAKYSFYGTQVFGRV